MHDAISQGFRKSNRTGVQTWLAVGSGGMEEEMLWGGCLGRAMLVAVASRYLDGRLTHRHAPVCALASTRVPEYCRRGALAKRQLCTFT